MRSRDPATGNIVCRSKIDPNAAFGGTTVLVLLLLRERRSAHLRSERSGSSDGRRRGLCTRSTSWAAILPTPRRLTCFATVRRTARPASSMRLPLSRATYRNGSICRAVRSVWCSAPNIAPTTCHTTRTSRFSLATPSTTRFRTSMRPKAEVKEAFGEIRLPLLKDLPLIRELEIDGAARVSDYKLGSTGTVWAYNGNVIYSPIDGVRSARQLRAARSARRTSRNCSRRSARTSR